MLQIVSYLKKKVQELEKNSKKREKFKFKCEHFKDFKYFWFFVLLISPFFLMIQGSYSFFLNFIIE